MIVTDTVGLRCVLGEHGGYKSKSSQNTTKQSEVYVDSWTPYQTLSEIDRDPTLYSEAADLLTAGRELPGLSRERKLLRYLWFMTNVF